MIAALLLRDAGLRLKAVEIPDPIADAQRLLAYVLEVDPSRVILHLQDTLSDEVCAKFENVISKRLARVPVSQIVGGRWFYGRWFKVTSDVLDPRPDTEALIVQTLREPFETMLDLGLGSGCILLTLLGEMPLATGVGSDVSEAALLIATDNAQAINVQDRATIKLSDWFEDIQGKFDLIVSNPPYIRADEMAGLAPEVREHEPHLALSPGGDGLSAYRIITEGAPKYLNSGGRLIVEIGPTQADEVRKMFVNAGFVGVEVSQDLDGRDRVVQGKMPA